MVLTTLKEKALEEAGRLKIILQELRAMVRKTVMSRDAILFQLKTYVAIKGRDGSSSTAASSTGELSDGPDEDGGCKR